jgi:hypothetical protein
MPESSQIQAQKPWALLVQYLPPVLRKWVALMTGSFPVAVYEIIAALPGDHLWNRPPSWVIWLAVLVAAVTAQFLTWRDVRNELEMLRREKNQELEQAAATIRELEAKLAPAFTSDGLAWETILGAPVDLREVSNAGDVMTMPGSFVTTVNIAAHGDGLPQPLNLRLYCSREPKDAYTTYYPDRTNIDRRHPTPLPASPVRIEGKCVYVEFREPRLKPPAMFAVTVRGETQQEIAVERVERLAGRVRRALQ